MDEQKVEAFLQWLPSKFEEFQNLNLDEIALEINRLYETEEGKQTIQTLWNTFLNESDNSTMFKKGGKLDYLVSLHKKGGQLNIKCSCGCAMHKVFEKGGVIDKCACGCKTNVVSKQEGGEIPRQQTSWLDRKLGRKNYQTTAFNDGRPGRAAELVSGNTLHRVIERPQGHYTNRTWQSITNFGQPNADTTYTSPKGNRFKPNQVPTWTKSFDNIFNKK